jgi:acyl carrier protein
MFDEATLLTVFTSVFPDLPASQLSTLSVASHPGWDSLATVTLIAVLEDEFEISIQPSEMEQFISFELIADLLTEKLK